MINSTKKVFMYIKNLNLRQTLTKINIFNKKVKEKPISNVDSVHINEIKYQRIL